MGELQSAVDTVCAEEPDGLDPAALDERIVEVSAQRNRLDAALARLIATQARRLGWKRDGAHSQKEWLAKHCRMTAGEAAGRARAARCLTALPATTRALADGAISSSSPRAAAAAVRDLPADALNGLDRLVIATVASGDGDPASSGRRLRAPQRRRQPGPP